jgi:hypothetical protein
VESITRVVAKVPSLGLSWDDDGSRGGGEETARSLNLEAEGGRAIGHREGDDPADEGVTSKGEDDKGLGHDSLHLLSSTCFKRCACEYGMKL